MTEQNRRGRHSPEMRGRAVRMVGQQRDEHASQWGRLSRLPARSDAVRRRCLGWVALAERDAGKRAGPTSEARDRIKTLEREVRELRQAYEILRQASAYFAQAEFDRRFKP